MRRQIGRERSAERTVSGVAVTPASKRAASNGDGPKSRVKEPAQIEAVKGEVLADGDGPKTRTMEWEGLTLVLPAEIGCSLMFSVTEAQLGDDSAILRAIRELIGDQWQACKQVAVERKLPISSFNDLISSALEMYGLGAGEGPTSPDSSANGSGA